ncbi:MAG: hypothetical protein AAGF95_14955 [Chloroflexota bacterium]
MQKSRSYLLIISMFLAAVSAVLTLSAVLQARNEPTQPSNNIASREQEVRATEGAIVSVVPVETENGFSIDATQATEPYPIGTTMPTQVSEGYPAPVDPSGASAELPTVAPVDVPATVINEPAPTATLAPSPQEDPTTALPPAVEETTIAEEITATAVVTPTDDAQELAVISFTLINADTDEPIEEFDPLIDGAMIDLATLPTRNINIRANTQPETVGSVSFGPSRETVTRIEDTAPYSLAGDDEGDYLPWDTLTGRYALEAVAYSEQGAQGEAGDSVLITFTITDTSVIEESETVVPES